MRVWIVNPFDNLPPEGYRPMRYWLMASAFSAKGHDVTYWTTDFSHANKAPRRMDPSFQPPGFRLRMLHEPPYQGNVSLGRMYSHWRWARTWRAAADGEPAPDAIVVSTPPLLVGREVRRIASRSGAKVVVDVMDDWPGTFERVAPRWMLAPLRHLARANILGASAVTVVADRYAELAREYGFAGEVRRFYHGIDLAPAPGSATGASGQSTRSDASRPLRLVYIGNLGRTYDLTTVMEALALLPSATLDVAGEGEQLAGLKANAENLPVRFHGYLGDEALARLLADSDVGIVPMAPESCVGVPYKFADYSKAGLAMASSLGGESGRLLAKYGAGVAYRGGDPQSLAMALRSLETRLDEAKSASRRMAEAEFDAGAIYREYVDFVEDVANGK